MSLLPRTPALLARNNSSIRCSHLRSANPRFVRSNPPAARNSAHEEAVMADKSAAVVVAHEELPAQQNNTFIEHKVSGCCVDSFKTTVIDGTAKVDKSKCCGLCADKIDIVALRNVSQWYAHTDSAGACARSGAIGLQLAGSSGRWIETVFMPALIGGRGDAFKVDAALRAESRKDRVLPSAFLAAPEMAKELTWSRKVGCCGCSNALCTNACCETMEQSVRVGPADSLSIVHDKAHPICCTRSLDVFGTVTGEVTFVAAEVPIGACGVTGDKPNFGALSCSCDEQAIFTVSSEPDQPLSSNTSKGESEAITSNVLNRVLADPSIVPEEKLRSFVSRHVCYGQRGELNITNKRVEYVGYKHAPYCCEGIAPGIPNLCCVLCQVHTKKTIPLDKVTDMEVEVDGPCKVIKDAADQCRCGLICSAAPFTLVVFAGGPGKAACCRKLLHPPPR